MDKKKLVAGIEAMLKEKGSRKFTQSVEVIFNFRGIDFSKPENRLNLDIALPHGKGGKEPKVVVIAEADMGASAKKAGADEVLSVDKLLEYKKDQPKLKKLVQDSVFLTQPNLLGQIAKNFGQFLAVRGKMPKPLVGNPENAINAAKRSVRISSKGKYMPVAQAFVGSEAMEPKQLAENIEAVYDAVKNKAGASSIKSAYVKLTMGKAVQVM
ncbi:50S ribosomal protein L1 [Candidatus Micrarchaeota archaeon]|nr:50S ribosomal protein L1 [Candidatus Micrarchaeota archaeon]MBD3418389.1 50S ribosomal protein L1 [Candidatus Micrarchaeota archaeon]